MVVNRYDHLHVPIMAAPQAQKPVTVPCAYKTGRTLGQGTYAVGVYV